MKKVYSLLAAAWLISGTVNTSIAQNLVLNPSFETVNTGNLKCSWYLSNPEMTAAISNWDMPTDGSTDIFHTSLSTTCFCSPFSTDPSAVGSQAPRTGSSMTALFTYGSGGCTPYREYIQGQLSTALVAGTTYKIEMYVSLADYSNRAANNIGVKFLTSRVYTGSMCVWSTTPDVNYTGPFITDKVGWTKISFCYTPTASNLLYFAIGNFYNDASTPTSAVAGSSGATRYFLDDVSITPASGSTSASASNNVTCSNNSVNLSTNIASASYTWSAPAGSSITSGVNSQNATAQGGGTYTVTVNNPSSCGSAISTAVVTVAADNTPPTIASASGGAINCASPNVTLNGNAGSVNYSWSGPGIVSGGSTASPVVNQPGTYNLTVTNPSNGCTANTSVLVTQNVTAPGASATAPSQLNCATTNVTLNSSPSGMNYSWSGPGVVSGGGSASPVVNQPGTYNLTVTDPSNGCSSNTSVVVSQNTTPPGASAAAGGVLNCVTTSINLSSSPAGMNYSWSGPGITSGGNTSSPSVNQPGTYNLTITDPSNGCSSNTSVVVSQNGTPPGASASAGGSLNCTTTNVNLSAGPAGMNYSWMGPGIVSGGNTSTPNVNQPGTYNLTVSDPSNGCSSNTSVMVSQNVTPPAATASAASNINCISSSISLTGGPAAMNYSWSGPGIVSGGTTANPTVNQPGTYNLTVTDPSNGCSANTSVAVSQNTNPPGASATTGGTLTCAVTTVPVSVTPAGMNYSWTGPGIVSGGNTSSATANQPGTYNVTVTDPSNGCTSTSSVPLTQNIAVPGATATASSIITCTATSISLNGNSSSGVSYSWSGPGIVSGGSTANPTVNQAGTYTLTVTGSNGCTSVSTATVSQDTSVPNVSASSTSTVTCISSTVSLTSLPAGLTYTWTAAAGSTINGTPNFQNVSADGPGPFTVFVYDPSNGCSSSVAVSPVVDNTPPTAVISAGNSGLLTCATTSLVLNAPNGGLGYNWTGPGIIAGSTTSSPTVNQPGTYSLTLTDLNNGCSSGATVTVTQDIVIPTVSIGPATFTTTCASPTVQLTATTSTPSVIYTWQSPSSGSLNNSSIVNPVASGTGVFTLVITNTGNGCSSSSATAEVFADAAVPSVSLSASSLELTCSATTISVLATAVGSDLTYSWTPAPLSGGNTNNPQFNVPGNYGVLVTNTVNSCITMANVSVSTNTTAPALTVSQTQTLTCVVTSVPLGASSSAASSTYTWTGPGITGSSNSPTVTVSQDGSYNIGVTDPANGCSGTAVVTVISDTVLPTATVSAISSNSTISCTSPTVSLNVNANPGTTSFLWSTGDNTAVTEVTNAGIITVTVTNTTNGCETTVPYNVTGNILLPPLITASAILPCASQTVTLIASSTNTNVSYTWSGPGPLSIIGSSNIASPVAGEVGTYSVIVTDLTTSCSSSAAVSVSQGSITAAFTANPLSGVSPLSVDFTNQSISAVDYNWTFGNGNTSVDVNPSQVFTGSATYTVMLVATAGPCADTAYATVVVDDDLIIEIPNVFTPNGDGTNDVFFIKTKGIKDISLEIFNRWGQKLYTFAGSNASWDGVSTQGEEVPDGTYFFFVKATGRNEKVIEKQGSLNLFR
jgi:gliding motility-associated-like protein